MYWLVSEVLNTFFLSQIHRLAGQDSKPSLDGRWDDGTGCDWNEEATTHPKSRRPGSLLPRSFLSQSNWNPTPHSSTLWVLAFLASHLQWSLAIYSLWELLKSEHTYLLNCYWTVVLKINDPISYAIICFIFLKLKFKIDSNNNT